MMTTLLALISTPGVFDRLWLSRLAVVTYCTCLIRESGLEQLCLPKGVHRLIQQYMQIFDQDRGLLHEVYRFWSSLSSSPTTKKMAIVAL